MVDIPSKFYQQNSLRQTMTAQTPSVPLWLMTHESKLLEIQFYDVNWDYFITLFNRNRANPNKTLYQNIFDVNRTEDFHITHEETFWDKDMIHLQKQMDFVLGHVLAILRVQTTQSGNFVTTTPKICAEMKTCDAYRLDKIMKQLRKRIGILCPARHTEPTADLDEDVAEEDLDIFCLDYTVSIDRLLFMKQATSRVDVVANVALTMVNGKIMTHYRFIEFFPKKVEEPPKPKPRRKPKRKATRSVADILNAKPNKLHRPRYKLY